MEKALKDWNTPAVGVGIVVNDSLMFAKGYVYRDYEKKPPVTPAHLHRACQIGSSAPQLRLAWWLMRVQGILNVVKSPTTEEIERTGDCHSSDTSSDSPVSGREKLAK